MKRVTLLAALALFVSSLVGMAQSFPLGLLPTSADEGGPLDAYVWTMESRIEIGASMEIHVAVNRSAFVYLFDLQPDGVVRLLFPNSFQRSNYVSGELVLPDDSYRLLAYPPAGIEELLVFASTLPLPIPLSLPDDPFPVFAGSPDQAIDQLVSLMSSMAPTTWAVGWTALQIVGDPEPEPSSDESILLPAPPTTMPPFPGSPGAAWYSDSGSWVPGIPSEGWYWYFGVESRWHLCWSLPQG